MSALVTLLLFLMAARVPEMPASADSVEPADLVLLSAKIWTGERARPQATALAARGGRIVALGTDAEVGKLRGPKTVVVDGKGRRVVPGFIDSHTHMSMGGFNLLAVDLRHTKDPADFTRKLAAFAKTRPAGLWMTDGAWDHQVWADPVLPTRAMLDPATGERPTCLSRTDGHMAVCNSRALALAKVSRETPDPPGGVIVRDARGEPTGLLKDAAMDLVWAVRPARSAVEVQEALSTAVRHAARNGVTSVQDLPGNVGDLDAWEALRREGKLTVRVDSRPSLSAWEKVRDRRARMKNDEWLRIGGVKGFVDGSLGSTTALMFEPYRDAPATRGLFVTPEDSLRRWIGAADSAGLQVVVHAIGDRANALLLDIFDSVAKAHGPRDRRFRIEHAQHLRAAEIPRFAGLNVIASMQPYHAADDGRWAAKRIGPELIRGTYAFRSLLDAGARLVFGSDWYVAPLDPRLGLQAAVTRQTLDGKNPGGWVPEQKITLEEALRAYTASNAYGVYAEGARGILKAGYRADFVVFDRDLTKTAPDNIANVRVQATVSGGRVVWETAAAPRP